MVNFDQQRAEAELARQAYEAQDRVCLETVRAEIARLASEAEKSLAEELSAEDRSTALVNYLVEQKIKVNVPRHYAGKVATGPITRWTVANDLRAAGFEPTAVVVKLVKKLKFRSREPYVTITFTSK
jgi:hypothetical protein